jgi:hypothetical protein
MNHTTIIKDLLKNKGVFHDLLRDTTRDQYSWKPSENKWCLLEVISHLYDAEREDFRARIKHTLRTPELPLPPIDPDAWVMERNYMERDFDTMLDKFELERVKSIEWLSEQENPNWKAVLLHPKLGVLTPELFLFNWLAHDYLHIRQITKLKYGFLKEYTTATLNYAGEW